MKPSLTPETWVICKDNVTTFHTFMGKIVGGRYDEQTSQWKYFVTNHDTEGSLLIPEGDIELVLHNGAWTERRAE